SSNIGRDEEENASKCQGIIIIIAVALFDQNVVSCFYPVPSEGHEAGAHGAADRHRRRREHAVRELPDHTPWHRVPTLAALIFSRILPARTPICAYPRLSSLDH
ncbi:hypothetical protein EE612_031150, partial [Oryza sativa]